MLATRAERTLDRRRPERHQERGIARAVRRRIKKIRRTKRRRRTKREADLTPTRRMMRPELHISRERTKRAEPERANRASILTLAKYRRLNLASKRRESTM